MSPSLESQVLTYWRLGVDLRLTEVHGLDPTADLEEIADFAAFTNHPRLRAACLSRVRCNVVNPMPEVLP